MVRDGVIVTPPATEGAFESITAIIAEHLAADLGIPSSGGRSIATELLVAEEIASAGSLNDFVLVDSIDGLTLGPAPILTRLRDRYFDAVTGVAPHPAVKAVDPVPRQRHDPPRRREVT